MTISASTTIGSVGGNTRATLGGESGLTPVWQTDDKIAVLIDDATEASELTLLQGADTRNGIFTGLVSAGQNAQKMHFFYPASAAASTGVDLTSQDGSNAQEMVMHATCDYSKTSMFTFTNKTSILKFSIPVPQESGWTTETNGLTATVAGAYSKGKLSADGTWSDLETAYISVSNIKVSSDGKVTGYAVVIPGSKATDLRIAISDADGKGYVTKAYTKAEATIPENQVVSISQAFMDGELLAWVPGTTQAETVKSYLGADGKDLTIFAMGEMGASDFVALRSVLGDDGGLSDINLTLLNQKTLPVYDNGKNYIGTFQECSALKEVIASDVESIEYQAFYYCKKLTSASLPKATTIGNSAFLGCIELTSVTLPKATTFGADAFSLCGNLTSVTLPEATTFGGNAFKNCSKLKSVTLPEATTFGDYAFGYCANLTSISLPKATTFGDYAFGGSINLTSVTLPKATNFGNYAFLNCKGLTSVTLPKATTFGKKAFEYIVRSNIDLTTWDASDWYKMSGTEEDNYGWKSSLNITKVNYKVNYTTANYMTWSEDNCNGAPTAEQMKMYLGAGVYWDEGEDNTDGNQQTYKLPIGVTCHAGLWVMKKEYIIGFSDDSAKKVENTNNDKSCWHEGRPAASEIGKYFFLPAAGLYDVYDPDNSHVELFLDPGSDGYYWSSSPGDGGPAYFLGFNASWAIVVNDIRDGRCLPMVAE